MYRVELRVFAAAKTLLLLEITAIYGGTENPFENKRRRYKEIAGNKADTYLLYVEHLFPAYDAVDALFIFKRAEILLVLQWARSISQRKRIASFGCFYDKAGTYSIRAGSKSPQYQ